MALFKDKEEFKKYVTQLSPEEIQGWTTDNWIEFYEKLKDMCDIKNISPREFVNNECLQEFIKLYSNYRMNVNFYNSIKSRATEVGKHLAHDDKIDATQAIIKNEESCLNQISIIADTVAREKRVTIDNDIDFAGLYSRTSGISVNLEKSHDDFVNIVAHESAHALYDLYLNAIDFYNSVFYLESPSIKYLENCAKNIKNISDIKTLYKLKEVVEKFKPSRKAYKHQPTEKIAYLWGYFCERAYRKEAGRPSERGALNLVKLIGMPEDMHYQENRIVMRYPAKHKTKLSTLSKILPEQISIQKNDDKTVSVSLLGDYKVNKLLYAISHSDNPNSALFGRFMEKSLKSVLQSKHTKRLAIALGLLIGGHVGTNLVKHVKQEMDLNAINKEWKMQYADADSVYADAKTATFYAHKNLTPEQKEELSKQVDELEKKYLDKINKSEDLQQIIGDRKIIREEESWLSCHTYNLDDGHYVADYRTQNVEKRVAYLREKIAEGKEYVVQADAEKGEKSENWTDMKKQEEVLKEYSDKENIVEAPEGTIIFHTRTRINFDFPDNGTIIKEKLGQQIKDKKSRH